MQPDQLDPQIRALATERRLPPSHLARWLAMDPASRHALLDLARALRFRTGQLVAAIGMLDEISVRECVTIASVLDRAELQRIANGPGSTPTRASLLLEALRALRFPLLTEMEEKLLSEISSLKLPRAISIDLPGNLGSDELTVSLRVRSASDLARLLDALDQKRAELNRIIEMLHGKIATLGH